MQDAKANTKDATGSDQIVWIMLNDVIASTTMFIIIDNQKNSENLSNQPSVGTVMTKLPGPIWFLHLKH